MRNPLSLLGNVVSYIKKFIQRGLHGISEEDMWNLDYYVSSVMIEGLRYLKENNRGYPAEVIDSDTNQINDADDKRYNRKWIKILEELEWTFDIAKQITHGDVEYVKIEHYEEMAPKMIELTKKHGGRVLSMLEIRRFNKGFRLFKKYFFSLWD